MGVEVLKVSTSPAVGSCAYSLTMLVGTGSLRTTMPTSPWSNPRRPGPQPIQNPGYVYAVPSYDVAPPKGYSGLFCTFSSIQIRAATAPSVQCPAVSTTVGESNEPEQRHAGPFASSNTRRPTYGCCPASG